MLEQSPVKKNCGISKCIKARGINVSQYRNVLTKAAATAEGCYMQKPRLIAADLV